MTIQIEEIRAGVIRNQTPIPNLGFNLSNFYDTTGNPADVLAGLEPVWLDLMGFHSTALDAKWAEYLTYFGFTGALRDGLQNEANLGHLFPTTYTPITFDVLLMESGSSILMEDGSKLLL